MAIVVPSSKLAITPRLAYGRGYPILSGEDSDDFNDRTSGAHSAD